MVIAPPELVKTALSIVGGRGGVVKVTFVALIMPKPVDVMP